MRVRIATWQYLNGSDSISGNRGENRCIRGAK